MKLQFIGSGGRFNTCFHVTGAHVNFLLDCGASSLIALKANKIALNEIQAILITHFHADHFGSIPFFMLDAIDWGDLDLTPPAEAESNTMKLLD